MVPGPGNTVPSSAEISAPPHMPWPMMPWNSVASAYSESRWAGLVSPETAAKASMSCCVRVRTMRAFWPIWISSKVTFSIMLVSTVIFMG